MRQSNGDIEHRLSALLMARPIMSDLNVARPQIRYRPFKRFSKGFGGAGRMQPDLQDRKDRHRDRRHWQVYLGLRLAAAVVRWLPLDISTELGARALRIFAPRFSARRHAQALDNLRIAFPDKSEAERRAICMAHWENLGRVAVETLSIDRILADPGRVEIAGADVLTRYRGKLGPAIGVSLHMGNWELAIWPLTLVGANPGAIYRTFDNPYVDAYLRSKRARLYPGGMFGRGSVEGDHGNDFEAVRALTDIVRRGGRFGIVSDQYYRRGVAVRSFGRVTRAQPIAALIARRVGARIWIARCLRIGSGSRFRIDFHELRMPRTSNPAEDVHQTLAAMHQQFEAWIREAPEQWLWAGRKWL